MKKLILTLTLLLTTLISNAQIGVITLKKNESVPLNMWYTIDENKIKHITETNQWEDVIKTILDDYNKVFKINNND